jgi:hypothetical protein
MNEIIPPSDPGKELPQPASTRLYGKSEPPSRKLCAALGFLLFVVSGGLAFLFPPLCLVGFAVAVSSLFFKGYRCIFIGYILTIGLILLGTIIYCSTHPFNMH